MCVPCVYHEEPMSLDIILILDSFQSFQILDPSRLLQTTLNYSRPMTSCHVTSQSHAFSLLLQTNNYYYYLYLICPNPNPKVCPHFCLITMGGVLLMKCEDKKQRLVAYISKSLNEAERNYEIHNKEMLAIIQCLEVWRYFLEGAKDQFEIWIDHKNLEYFIKAKQALYLSRFDFTLKYVAGKSMR